MDSGLLLGGSIGPVGTGRRDMEMIFFENDANHMTAPMGATFSAGRIEGATACDRK